MFDLPRGYKLKRQPKLIEGSEYNEVYVSIKVPAKYKFTDKDIFSINHEVIKPEDGLSITQNKSGGVYVNDFDVTKKKIDLKKFVEAVPRKFTTAIRKFNNDS
jgi:hypothetical protein